MTNEGDICSDILKALKILVTPLKTATDQSESFDLETALQKNISNLDTFLQENKTLSSTWENESLSSYITDICLSWQFTYRCLKLLHLLQDSLKKAQTEFEKKEFKKDLKPSQAPPLSPDTLSFEQQKHILTALQFIICLSVCPNLQKGVGLPLSKRTGFNSILSTFLSENGSIHMGIKSIEDSYCKLLMCAKILVSCLDVPSIGVLVLSRHLNDVLAILIQLTYGISKCKEESSQSNINLLISKSEEFCNAALKTVINNVRPSMLVRELLVLQGGPRTKKVQPGMLPPAPLWMRKACGQLLTDILLKPDGVFHVIHGVAGNEVTNQVSVTNLSDWRKCEAAAKIIAHCPMQSASIDQYFERITPQLLSLLHAPDQQKSALYLRVCCSIIKEINQQHPTKTHQYILKPLLHPLLKCTNGNALFFISF